MTGMERLGKGTFALMNWGPAVSQDLNRVFFSLSLLSPSLSPTHHHGWGHPLTCPSGHGDVAR